MEPRTVRRSGARLGPRKRREKRKTSGSRAAPSRQGPGGARGAGGPGAGPGAAAAEGGPRALGVLPRPSHGPGDPRSADRRARPGRAADRSLRKSAGHGLRGGGVRTISLFPAPTGGLRPIPAVPASPRNFLYFFTSFGPKITKAANAKPGHGAVPGAPAPPGPREAAGRRSRAPSPAPTPGSP